MNRQTDYDMLICHAEPVIEPEHVLEPEPVIEPVIESDEPEPALEITKDERDLLAVRPNL